MTPDLRSNEDPDSDPSVSSGSFDTVTTAPEADGSEHTHPMSVARRASPGQLPIWVQAVIAVAVVHIGVSLILYFSAPLPVAPQSPRDPAVLPPWWLYAALASTFLALGLGLVVANRRDARAAWLGGVLILAGVPFAALLLEASSRATWLLNVRPDAFTAALFWSFLARFPTEFESPAARTAVRVVAAAAAIAGLWCAIATLALLWVPQEDGWPWLMAFALAQRTLYWPTVLGFVAPTFPVLLWRAATAKGTARHQITLFVIGLLIGFVPFTVEVLIEEMVPAYRAWAYGPTMAPWIGTVIFAALAVVPFVTAYSVLFDRVVDVRVVLRAAAQYVLARYTIVGATLVPFAALALFLVEHRAEPIVSLVTGTRPLTLGSVITIGLVSFRLRSRWLDVLDHRYFRESYEAHDVLGRIVALPGTSAEELADSISQELARTFHSETHVFLADETRTALRHTGERLPPIAVGSRLLDLVLADPRPMDIDVDDPQSLLSRLPDEEQHWLRSSSASLLISLRSSRGSLEGVLSLTTKRSGLPFSSDDRRLLAAIGSVASMAFESLRLRSAPPTPIEQPARECLQCRRLTAFETERCECGGDLVVANVPHVLRGTFKFKRRIGAGGMGVVYRAVDLTLNRDVAMKALPRVTPELITRLKREARAMAAVTHPNLAVIHGVETWQGMPFLVEEYLGGGTLAQRLAAARFEVREAIDLGLTLASVLQHMHTSGVIHCDIKPSNIGFTQHGTVKLLDFGLARVTRDLNPASVATASGHGGTPADVVLETGGGWFGTPPYMSPEAANAEPAAPSFDLWALAVVLYESMAGARPFRGQDAWETLERIRTSPAPDIRDIWSDAPAPVAAFFETALALDPARRPPDAGAFGAALRRLRDRIG
ncbi:MAG TPA: serine/threonine-protein kinase [Vicinamibacterales bacterium]|nr:serine/threonine-protein kinase [Vicinamibacterales bacterium]